jgi:ribosomal-protein-alanine N-acetyltransferase
MLAFEAVNAIVDIGLNSLNLQTIKAKVCPLNRGAIAILEKLGFVKDAHFKNRVYFNNVFSDMAVYTRHKLYK